MEWEEFIWNKYESLVRAQDDNTLLDFSVDVVLAGWSDEGDVDWDDVRKIFKCVWFDSEEGNVVGDFVTILVSCIRNVIAARDTVPEENSVEEIMNFIEQSRDRIMEEHSRRTFRVVANRLVDIFRGREVDIRCVLKKLNNMGNRQGNWDEIRDMLQKFFSECEDELYRMKNKLYQELQQLISELGEDITMDQIERLDGMFPYTQKRQILECFRNRIIEGEGCQNNEFLSKLFEKWENLSKKNLSLSMMWEIGKRIEEMCHNGNESDNVENKKNCRILLHELWMWSVKDSKDGKYKIHQTKKTRIKEIKENFFGR